MSLSIAVPHYCTSPMTTPSVLPETSVKKGGILFLSSLMKLASSGKCCAAERALGKPWSERPSQLVLRTQSRTGKPCQRWQFQLSTSTRVHDERTSFAPLDRHQRRCGQNAPRKNNTKVSPQAYYPDAPLALSKIFGVG